jgi:hypothetical protein
MKCSDVRLLISTSMDETLAEYERAGLARHLASCADCVQYQSQLAQGHELLRSHLAAPAVNFEWKVQLKIQQALREAAARRESPPRQRFWLPVGASALVVAAVVVLVGGAWILGRTSLPGGLDPSAGKVTNSDTPRVAQQSPAPGGGGRAEQARPAPARPQSRSDRSADLPGFVEDSSFQPQVVSSGQVILPARDDAARTDAFLDPGNLTARRQLLLRRQELQREDAEIRRLLEQGGHDLSNLSASDTLPVTDPRR